MTDDQQLLANLERIATREELVWNDAADPDELESLEASLGIEVPSAYRSVLEWHDGTDDREFCSIEESVEAAEELLELWEDVVEEGNLDPSERNIEPGTGRVKDGDFAKGWVPFYDYGTGAFDLLDCNPGPNGSHGQVIHYDPDGTNAVTHPTLAAWAAERAAH